MLNDPPAVQLNGSLQVQKKITKRLISCTESSVQFAALENNRQKRLLCTCGLDSDIRKTRAQFEAE